MLGTLTSSWSFCCWFLTALIATDNMCVHSSGGCSDSNGSNKHSPSVDEQISVLPLDSSITARHGQNIASSPGCWGGSLGTRLAKTGDSPFCLHTDVMCSSRSRSPCLRGREQKWYYSFTGTLPLVLNVREDWRWLFSSRFWLSLVNPQSLRLLIFLRGVTWHAGVWIVKMSRDDSPKEKKKGKRS